MPEARPIIAAHLTRLLCDLADGEARHGAVRLECRTIGELTLPSGRIVACDAAVEPGHPPFVGAVMPGRYPVRVAIAHLAGGDHRIAGAWLRFAEGAPARWEPAPFEGVPEHADHAYGVDSATGAFVSLEGARRLAALTDDRFAEAVGDAMDASYRDTRAWAVIPVPGDPPLEAAVFSSGAGDGAYPSYWGYGDDGAPRCLLTDFRILSPEDADASGAGALASRPWWKVW